MRIAIRRFLRAALEGDGLRVHDAGTLQQGLIEAATRKPDTVILDLGLPDGDGIDFYPGGSSVEPDADSRALCPY